MARNPKQWHRAPLASCVAMFTALMDLCALNNTARTFPQQPAEMSYGRTLVVLSREAEGKHFSNEIRSGSEQRFGHALRSVFHSSSICVLLQRDGQVAAILGQQRAAAVPTQIRAALRHVVKPEPPRSLHHSRNVGDREVGVVAT